MLGWLSILVPFTDKFKVVFKGLICIARTHFSERAGSFDQQGLKHIEFQERWMFCLSNLSFMREHHRADRLG